MALLIAIFASGCTASTSSNPTAADCPDAGDFDLCAERARDVPMSEQGQVIEYESCHPGETLLDAGCSVLDGSPNDMLIVTPGDGGILCRAQAAAPGERLRLSVSCCLR